MRYDIPHDPNPSLPTGRIACESALWFALGTSVGISSSIPNGNQREVNTGEYAIVGIVRSREVCIISTVAKCLGHSP